MTEQVDAVEATDTTVDGGPEEVQAPAEANTSDKPIMVPKSRLDEEIAKRKAAEGQIGEWQSEAEKREQETLAQQGKFKELYESAEAKAQKLEQELGTMRFDSMRQKVASEAGFPALWNRLQGDNEEELKADMAKLAEVIPAQSAPNLDANAGSGTEPTDKDGRNKLTSAEKEYWAGVLGVEKNYLPEQFSID